MNELWRHKPISLQIIMGLTFIGELIDGASGNGKFPCLPWLSYSIGVPGAAEGHRNCSSILEKTFLVISLVKSEIVSILGQHLLRHKVVIVNYCPHHVHFKRASSVHFHVARKTAVVSVRCSDLHRSRSVVIAQCFLYIEFVNGYNFF